MEKIMRFLKWGAVVFFILFLLIQLVPVDKTNPPIETEIPAPEEVRSILKRSCYDCHSNETSWPWYSRVAPISWLVVYDVKEGRDELNFSTWNKYSTSKQNKKLKEIWDEIDEGEMPLWVYLPAHPKAKLSANDKAILQKWTQLSENQLLPMK
jgi:hypothetical protein